MNSLGRYQLLRPLAKIGADQVFLAQTVDAGGSDYHKVRRIRDGTVEDARRAAWLRHPNLVSIRELGTDGGGWYLATEYVHGEDLGRVLARVRRINEQVPIALITAIGAAAAAGLHHAHTHSGSRRTRRGSVHGAVSPACIVVGYDGGVKVGGLGVPAAADASYLAPEQARARAGEAGEASEAGEAAEIDARTDVFALGIVLYELATSRRLFRAPSDFLTKAAITEPNIPAPSRFRRGLPRALENIILKALAPVPANRFKSAGELRAALAGLARRVGMQVSPAGVADYLKALFGARPVPWLSAARTGPDPDDDDDDQLGVAAPPEAVLRELGVPEARALEATPSRGTKTPMSWTSQAPPPPPPRPWRRRALLAAGAVAAGLAAIFAVGAMQGGAERGVVPASAPPPPPGPQSFTIVPPPPPPPPPPDASPGEGSAAIVPAPAPARAPAVTPARPRPSATHPASKRERPQRRVSMASRTR